MTAGTQNPELIPRANLNAKTCQNCVTKPNATVIRPYRIIEAPTIHFLLIRSATEPEMKPAITSGIVLAGPTANEKLLMGPITELMK